jgi:hypothetical protein
MRSLLFAVLALGPFAVVSSAQENVKAYESTPTFEVSAGYDYVRYNANPKIPGVPTSENVNGNGGDGQFTFNPYSHVGLVAEVGAYAISRQGFATTHEVSYLFGPRINLRRGRVTPFVQTLFGRQWAEDGTTFGSVSAYAMTVGGGFDVAISNHIAIRPAQVEYFLTKFYDGNNNQQNNFRFGAGIVFRFAQK